jgi:hypothetical protein
MSSVSGSAEVKKVSFMSSTPGILSADFNVRLQETGSDCVFYANTYAGRDGAGQELPQPLKAILDVLFSETCCADHVYVHPFTIQVTHSKAVDRGTVEKAIEEALTQ